MNSILDDLSVASLFIDISDPKAVERAVKRYPKLKVYFHKHFYKEHCKESFVLLSRMSERNPKYELQNIIPKPRSMLQWLFRIYA